jgi:hypothetical protein
MNESRFPGLVRLFVLGCVLITPATESGEWATYQNEKFGYEIDYPVGWELIESRSRTNDTAHRAGEVLIPGVHQWVAFKEPEGKLWPGTLEVRVHEHHEGQTLGQWADSTNVDVHDDSLVTGAEETVLAGRPAKRFSVFSFDHTEIIVAFIHDGKIYEIRHAGSNPNDPDIEEHASVYEQMQRTFKLAPTTPTGAFDLGDPCDDGLGAFLSSISRYPTTIESASSVEGLPS